MFLLDKDVDTSRTTTNIRLENLNNDNDTIELLSFCSSPSTKKIILNNKNLIRYHDYNNKNENRQTNSM